MKVIGSLSILPRVPNAIGRLEELAHNLWWSWNPDAQELFSRLDDALWDAVSHNPVKLLREVSQRCLDEAAADIEYLAAYGRVMAEFDRYMHEDADTWYRTNHSDGAQHVMAYFSAEFGLHEALPIYSGGLGILSGDHIKAASDLGLPLVGVGFLYPQGYFTQVIDPHGRQIAEYEKIDFAEVPAVPALNPEAEEVLVSVDLPGRTVYAKVWRIQVGRVPVYLLDTDVERNAPQDRELSARLYGGDREVRISQEIVLGIGGVRAIRALGYDPAVWHMNEGHSAFLGLERVRELVDGASLSFDEAVEAVRSSTVFTTHTPVPAGNDAFSFELIDKFFWHWWGRLGIDRERFIDFARQELDWGPQYSMTVLALRLSGYHNGVSEIHGRVSREMWQFLWPDTPAYEVPIGHITNGVHTGTWLPSEIRSLYDAYLPANWMESVEQPEVWRGIERIPDAEMWEVHRARKDKLIRHIRQRVRRQYLRHGEGARRVRSVDGLFNPDALTIGFARRFATYKRATLLFRDVARIRKILSNPDRPVQIVFAGKAHPADDPGKALIQRIHEMSREPEFEGKIVFVEDYDMNLARDLISGADVWLNTPRRPREASGTSGQKAALCGVPSFSVLDGWWAEGYDGENGWVIGEDRPYKDTHTQDEADADSLYHTLEDEIIPLFYDRDAQGVPAGWVRQMKNAVQTCGPAFSMQRMLIDYVEQYYSPAIAHGHEFVADNYAAARAVAVWKQALISQWDGVQIWADLLNGDGLHVDDPIEITARLRLPAGVKATDVSVEAVYGHAANDGGVDSLATLLLEGSSVQDGEAVYRGTLMPAFSGKLVVGVRARPRNELLVNSLEVGKMRWA